MMSNAYGDSSNYDNSISMSGNKRFDSPSRQIPQQQSNLELNKFAYSFDVKFIDEDYNVGTTVKMVQAKLYKVNDYYSTAIDADLTSSIAKVDHMKILEIESMNYKLDLCKKGGNSILSDYSPNGFKRHICQLEFASIPDNSNKIIIKYDNKAKLSLVVLNSIHILYCQCYFYSTDTNIGYYVNLFDMVNPDDHPTFDSRGKTSLWIDDIQWSPNDLFCLVALRSRDIAILSRLGQLLKFVSTPSLDIMQGMRLQTDASHSVPRMFHELINPSADLQTESRASTKDKLKIMFEDNKLLIKDKQVHFVYDYFQHPDILPLLSWCKTSSSDLSFNFLKL